MKSINISGSLVAKSDQLNADDLIGEGASLKLEILSVNYDETRTDQPLWIEYKGGEGRPWKPCKTMRRVIAAIWGVDAAIYIGRTLEVYRDEKVKWAGAEVGGIRIRSMSNINTPKTIAVQVARGRKEHYLVQPLAARPDPEEAAESAKVELLAKIDKINQLDEISDFLQENDKVLQRMEQKYQEKYDQVIAVLQMQQDRIKAKEQAGD